MGGYDESFVGYEDGDSRIGVLEAGYPCRVLQEILFFYRVRPGSLVRACDTPGKSTALRRKIIGKHTATFRALAVEALAEKERLIAECRDHWARWAAEARRLFRAAPLAMIAAWLIGRRARDDGTIRFILRFPAAVAANAAVCASISSVDDRYGARVVWLIPLCAPLTLARGRRR